MPIIYTDRGVPRADLGEAFHEFFPDDADYIASKLLPPRGVPVESGKIAVLTREDLLTLPDDKHANGGAFNRITMAAQDIEFSTNDTGLEMVLTDKDRATYVNDFDAELETIELLRNKRRNKMEVRTREAVFDTTLWTGSDLFTDYSGDPWDDPTSDIIGQVTAAREKVRRNTGMSPETMAIGQVSLNNMLKNTDIKSRFIGIAVLTEEIFRSQLAAILGLRNLFVGRAIYNSADEGQDNAGTDIWPDDYAMICRLNTTGLKTGGLGRKLYWDQMNGESLDITQYREPQVKGDVFQYNEFTEEKIFDEYFGHLIQIDV